MNCKSRFADDEGDMQRMTRCELSEGHSGRHVKSGELYGQEYTITWTGGMPIPCTRCGVEKHPSDLILEQGETLCGNCWLSEYDEDA